MTGVQTCALPILFSLLLVLAVNILLWPQLVLFRQKSSARLRNAALFFIKRFWRVMGVGLVQLVYIAVLVLFAPWTIFLLPVTGMWYAVFLPQLLIYEQLNQDFRIEESLAESFSVTKLECHSAK